MKLKILVTALALSASTAAFAKPILQVDATTDLSIRDHRGAWRPTWSPLSPMVNSGGKKVIKIEERRDNLTAIRLQSGTGATYIYAITLRFDDRTSERIEVNKWLYSREPNMTIDLPQHRGGLARVVVSTFSWDPSTFQVMGKQMRPIIRPEPRPLPPEPMPQLGVVIGKDLTFANTDGYVHVAVGSDKGRFSKVTIDSLGSGTFIGQVHIVHTTGTYQKIDVNRALYAGEKLELQIEGKGPQAVSAITLMAHNDVRAMRIGPMTSRFNVTLF